MLWAKQIKFAIAIIILLWIFIQEIKNQNHVDSYEGDGYTTEEGEVDYIYIDNDEEGEERSPNLLKDPGVQNYYMADDG